MAMWILKGLSLAGIALCAVLMAVKTVKIAKSDEKEEDDDFEFIDLDL